MNDYYPGIPRCYCGSYPHYYYQAPLPAERVSFHDEGKKPFVINIENAAIANTTYRTALWTGKYLQATLMSIQVGDDIGLERHEDHDQFLRIEQGQGMVEMGKAKNNLTFRRWVSNNSAIFVPAGFWHNVRNTGNTPLKLYSIYAPPEHPFGTVHQTKEDA